VTLSSNSPIEIARDALSLWLTSKNIRKNLAIPLAALAPDVPTYQLKTLTRFYKLEETHKVRLLAHGQLSNKYHESACESRSPITRQDASFGSRSDRPCFVCGKRAHGEVYLPWLVKVSWILECPNCQDSNSILFMHHDYKNNCTLKSPTIIMACGCKFSVSREP
jgi:hypothetical protein